MPVTMDPGRILQRIFSTGGKNAQHLQPNKSLNTSSSVCNNTIFSKSCSQFFPIFPNKTKNSNSLVFSTTGIQDIVFFNFDYKINAIM